MVTVTCLIFVAHVMVVFPLVKRISFGFAMELVLV